MLNVLEEAVAVESSRQVDSTPMFIGKETCTTSHNMITGSSLLSSTNRPLGSIESEKNTNHEGVSLITSPAKAPGYNEEGLCSNNTIIDVATITTANQYYRHPDQMVQMGSHHLPLYPAVPHKQHNIIAAAEDSHPTCKTGQLGNASLHIQPQPGHYSQYDTDQLRLPQLQALSHLQAASNHLCSTEVLTQLEPLQPAGGTDHAGVPCVHGMAFKTTVQQHSRALEAAVMHRQGKADEYVIERERHSVRRAVQMQYMNKSPEGSSMVSIYNMDQREQEQEGVHRNGGSCSVGGSTQMNRWGQYNVMQVHLDIIQGQSLQMRSMKKRRLTNEQVKSLEGSFETESKLEAERKKELAQELGLQPRQVAVWFQNRRARFKAKQLERDFHLLNRQYHALLSEKDTLLAQWIIRSWPTPPTRRI